MNTIEFSDHLIPYQTFLTDIATLVVKMLKAEEGDPDYITQNTAFKMFGRGNVERWKREGKVKPSIRPGKVEYRTSELRFLHRKKQDYLKNNR